MGLGQSSQEEKEKSISTKFSTNELTKLEQLYKDKNEEAAKGWHYQSLKDRILAAFGEILATKIMKFLHSRSISKEGEEIVQEEFLRLVYFLTKDLIKELAETVFHIAGDGNETVSKESMRKFLSHFVLSLQKGISSEELQFSNSEGSCGHFVLKLIENFPDKMTEADFDIVLHRTPLLIDILQYKFRLTFFDYIDEGSKEVQGTLPCLIPKLILPKECLNPDTFQLSLPDVIFLNSRLPVPEQHSWRLLYSSKIHGESFSKMTGAMIDKGPTLVVVRDSHGHLFGGYASDSWKLSSQFQGTHKCFLFTVEPTLADYRCTGAGYNDHFMYLNIGQETMPNGLGMGGQHNFFGLWLDKEFGNGHSRAKPACTTYGSPQLSKEEEFHVEGITVWGVGDEPKTVGDDDEYNENMTSILDKNIEAKALLEIAGKPRVSEGLRDIEPDADIPEMKELRVAHDPMT